jgi:hypothetical protein
MKIHVPEKLSILRFTNSRSEQTLSKTSIIIYSTKNKESEQLNFEFRLKNSEN